MSLPSAYLTSTKNLAGILDAIQKAQAPPRFTLKFLEGLGFSSSSDRLIINVLKSLGLLSDTGEPTSAYHEYLDRSEGKRVLARGIRAAYSDLFQINKSANTMSQADVKNKMKTLSQGEYSDAVIAKMAATFKALVGQADFSGQASGDPVVSLDESDRKDPDPSLTTATTTDGDARNGSLAVKGLVYNINIHLPESRDPAVYDALFRSLREHLA